MKISLLITNSDHPVNGYAMDWMARNSGAHDITICRDKRDLVPGDLLFLISCNQIVDCEYRNRFRYTFVLHFSDLPKGRGWSPYIWDILAGATEVVVTLLEADNAVDSGDIWLQQKVVVEKTDLLDEILNNLFITEFQLIDKLLNEFDELKPVKQDKTIDPTYYRKRTPADSEIDVNQSIAEAFNHIRLCDNDRFPAFFYYCGVKYNLFLEKASDDK